MTTIVRNISRKCLLLGRFRPVLAIGPNNIHLPYNAQYSTNSMRNISFLQTSSALGSQQMKYCQKVNVSDSKVEETADKKQELSRKDKLKLAIKEYGSTVIIFHVSISLVSLGTCYMLVSNGVDVESLLNSIGFSSEKASKLATTSGTFVASYAIHKMLAPVRISITLGATPFIVRYLRQKGWIKKP